MFLTLKGQKRHMQRSEKLTKFHVNKIERTTIKNYFLRIYLLDRSHSDTKLFYYINKNLNTIIRFFHSSDKLNAHLSHTDGIWWSFVGDCWSSGCKSVFNLSPQCSGKTTAWISLFINTISTSISHNKSQICVQLLKNKISITKYL